MPDNRVQQAYSKVKGQMPDVGPVDVSPSDSIISRWMMPRGSIAVTNPFTGNITYNPDQMSGLSDDEMQNVLAHEMTHSGQAQKTPWYKTVMGLFQSDAQVPGSIKDNPQSLLNNPYFWRPEEQEGFQTERDRILNQRQAFARDPMTQRGDISLPDENTPILNPMNPMYKKVNTR